MTRLLPMPRLTVRHVQTAAHVGTQQLWRKEVTASGGPGLVLSLNLATTWEHLNAAPENGQHQPRAVGLCMPLVSYPPTPKTWTPTPKTWTLRPGFGVGAKWPCGVPDLDRAAGVGRG